MLQSTLAQIETNARGVLASSDPEYLHQLRVALRRLRAALRAFRTLVHEKRSKRLRRRLRKLSPILGEARDWDVLLSRLRAANVPARLIGLAEARRDKARKKARRAIAAKSFARTVREARALTVAENSRGLAAFAGAALERAHRKLFKDKEIDWHDAAQRHAMRIRVKRLRYSSEFFACACPSGRTTAYLAELKALQAILGELNDIAVGRRLLGFEVDETELLRKLERAWARFARRRPFWRARA